MRLFAISDLHLEKRPLDAIPRPTAPFDLLVCAGDVWEGEPERGLDALVALADGRPVLVVPGNHDRYRRGPDDPRRAVDLLAEQRAAAARLNAAAGRAAVTVLDRAEAVEIGGVAFIGATLWTDWTLAGLWQDGAARETAMAAATAHVTDPETGSREYRGAILRPDGAPWSPADALAAHRADRARLAAALARPGPGPRVVVTHHAPLTRILDPYRGRPGVPWWIPAFYGSTLLEDLPPAHRPEVWISGHFHAAHDLVDGGTRCVANPAAAADFDPGLTIEVGAAPSPSRGGWARGLRSRGSRRP
jgi:Icc-related predicted phosphoesterase